jgi:hypothetical protein
MTDDLGWQPPECHSRFKVSFKSVLRRCNSRVSSGDVLQGVPLGVSSGGDLRGVLHGVLWGVLQRHPLGYPQKVSSRMSPKGSLSENIHPFLFFCRNPNFPESKTFFRVEHFFKITFFYDETVNISPQKRQKHTESIMEKLYHSLMIKSQHVFSFFVV